GTAWAPLRSRRSLSSVLGKAHRLLYRREFACGAIEPGESPSDLCAVGRARFVQDLRSQRSIISVLRRLRVMAHVRPADDRLRLGRGGIDVELAQNVEQNRSRAGKESLEVYPQGPFARGTRGLRQGRHFAGPTECQRLAYTTRLKPPRFSTDAPVEAAQAARRQHSRLLPRIRSVENRGEIALRRYVHEHRSRRRGARQQVGCQL